MATHTGHRVDACLFKFAKKWDGFRLAACPLALLLLLAAGYASRSWASGLLLAAALTIALDKIPRIAGSKDRCGALLVCAGLLYAIVVLGAAGLDQMVQERLATMLSPLGVNPIEGREALKGWLLARGVDIYPSVAGRTAAYPLLITLYPPLYYGVAALWSAIVGPGLLCGKLAAASGGALMLAALFGLGRIGLAAGVGGVAALLFFVQPEAATAFVCKPDPLAFGLLLCGLWTFESGRARPERNWLPALSGALLAGACLAKQQVWPMVGAMAGVVFFLRLSWRQRRMFLAGLLGTGIVLGGGAYLWFGRGVVEQVVFFPQAMTRLAAGNTSGAALERMTRFAAEHALLLGIYAVWLGACLARRRLPLPDLMLVVFVPFLWRTLMWGGADTNHFLFVVAVACLGVARLAGTLLAGGSWARAGGLALLAVLLPAHVGLSWPSEKVVAEAAAQVAEVRRTLAGIPGPVLLDAEGAYVFAGGADFSRLRLYDAFETDIYDQLGLAPILDSVMADDLRRRAVARFVDSQVFISPTLLELVNIFYEPAERVGRYAFYRPRPEKAIIPIPAVDRVSRDDAGWTCGVVEAGNIRQWGGYVQAESPDSPLVLVYNVVGAHAARRAWLSLCPRFTAPGQSLTVTALVDGAEVARRTFRYGDFPDRGEGFDNRSRIEFIPNSASFQIRFETVGAAQLWQDTRRPMVMAVE